MLPSHSRIGHELKRTGAPDPGWVGFADDAGPQDAGSSLGCRCVTETRSHHAVFRAGHWDSVLRAWGVKLLEAWGKERVACGRLEARHHHVFDMDFLR